MSRFIEIPFGSISEDALKGILEEFVTRDGTDYGCQETQLTTKVESVRQQLKGAKLVIVFDSYLTATQIVSVDQWRSMSEDSQ